MDSILLKIVVMHLERLCAGWEMGVSTFGELATLSFLSVHHITMGEGAILIDQNETVESESFRDWGRDCY